MVWLMAEAYGNKTCVFVDLYCLEVRSVKVPYIDIHLTITSVFFFLAVSRYSAQHWTPLSVRSMPESVIQRLFCRS